MSKASILILTSFFNENFKYEEIHEIMNDPYLSVLLSDKSVIFLKNEITKEDFKKYIEILIILINGNKKFNETFNNIMNHNKAIETIKYSIKTITEANKSYI